MSKYSMSITVRKYISIIVVITLATLMIYNTASYFIRQNIIEKRMFQMVGIKAIYTSSPLLYDKIDKLSYLDHCKKYPIIPLLIFEGENAIGYPPENSWRSNCDIVNDSGYHNDLFEPPSKVT